MHTHFFLINRSQYAMQNHLFQYKRFASATHIASFHIGNMPYASGTAIPFGPGLKNPMDLRFIFGLGMGNLIRIRLRFIRGIENPAGLRFIFIRRIKESPFFQVPVSRRNSIRPTNDHANGRMSGKIDRVSVRFYPMKTKMAGDSMVRYPRKGVWGCPILVVRFLDHMPGLHFEVTVDYIDG